MRFKRLLALLLAAALALAVLVGCGSGQQSAAQALLKLLDGKYPNISIEIDPELEADLRQAISQAEAENAGDDAAAIRAALEKLVGSTVTFRYLGEGQQGDTAFDLVFYAGTDIDKAAQAAYSQWNIVFANVPDDGKYGTGLAMVETDNGIWMLVKATVEKAGSRDDGPDPVTLEKLSVTAPTGPFYAGGTFSPAGMVVTATYSDGSTKDIDLTQCTLKINGQPAENYRFTEVKDYSLTVSFGGQTATVTIPVSDNANGYYQDSGNNYVVTGSNGLQQLFTDKKDNGDFTGTITLTCDQTVKDRLADTFKGTLEGKEGSKPTITLTGNEGLFGTIVDGGEVAHLDVTVTGTINTGTEYASNAYATGAVADVNNGGSITGCTVTVNGSITATRTVTSDENTLAAAGGIVGTNGGTIENCDATISGSITAASSTNSWSFTDAYAGGIAGRNEGAIKSSCSVELNGGSIQATATATGTGDDRTLASAGGIAGNDFSKGVKCGPATGTGTSNSNGSVTLTLKGSTVAVAPNTIQPDSNDIYKDGYACAGTKTAS